MQTGSSVHLPCRIVSAGSLSLLIERSDLEPLDLLGGFRVGDQTNDNSRMTDQRRRRIVHEVRESGYTGMAPS
jgi:hypothetical protein